MLTENEKLELRILEDYQKSVTRWMSQEEQDRLIELRIKDADEDPPGSADF